MSLDRGLEQHSETELPPIERIDENLVFLRFMEGFLPIGIALTEIKVGPPVNIILGALGGAALSIISIRNQLRDNGSTNE